MAGGKGEAEWQRAKREWNQSGHTIPLYPSSSVYVLIEIKDPKVCFQAQDRCQTSRT